MSLSALLIFASSYPIFQFLLCFAGILLKKKEKEVYSFLSFFPYEIFIIQSKQNIFLRILQIIAALSPISFYSFYFVAYADKYPSLNIFTALMISIMVLSAASYFLMTLIKPKKHKFFISLFLVCLLSTSLECIIFSLFITKYGQLEANQSVANVASIVMLCLAFLNVASLFDPKLKEWDRLKQEIRDDGSIIFIRPKFFPLAFHEWMSVFAKITSEIIAAIFIYII